MNSETIHPADRSPIGGKIKQEFPGVRGKLAKLLLHLAEKLEPGATSPRKAKFSLIEVCGVAVNPSGPLQSSKEVCEGGEVIHYNLKALRNYLANSSEKNTPNLSQNEN